MSGPLVVAGEVIEIKQIPNADRIRLATVSCGSAGIWSGVVGLELQVPDDVVVFLQDALLPPDERWAFMEKQNWRVKMCRFRGAPSECLILKADRPHMHEIGADLTELYGVKKYEKPLPVGSAGDIIGGFPSWISKTDEENFQRVHDALDRMRDGMWYATEKADGTSCTVWNDEDGMHVCSRNFELKEFTDDGASNLYWRMARKYQMNEIDRDYAIQFEILGPGVQGNPMGLSENEVRLFNVYIRSQHKRMGFIAMRECVERYYGIPMAREIELLEHQIDKRDWTEDDLRKLAEIKYQNGKPGEGIVIRDVENTWSFKCLNLLYKD